MLELDHVSVVYNAGTPAEVRALHEVSLSAPTGEFITVVGANGSGKSTLVGVLAGATAPSNGRVIIDGVDATREAVHRRAARVARVFDDPRAGSAPELSVEENLALAMSRGRRRRLRPAVTASRRERMRRALAELGLGLEDRLQQPVGLLSAGQRQSLTMIMATLRTPSVLLLDEHLAALDPTTAVRVLAVTRELAASAGSTTVMVTHDMEAAISVGDRLLVIRAGRIAADLAGEAKRALDVSALTSLLRADSLDEAGHRPTTASIVSGPEDDATVQRVTDHFVGRSGR